MIKKSITCLIAIVLALQLFSFVKTEAINASSYGLNNPRVAGDVSTWDCVYFGRYQQSSDGKGGFKTEPIKWRVLWVDGNDAFLFADKALDVQKYNPTRNITWSQSSIRSWLNEDFLNTAFTTKEKEKIKITAVLNASNPKYSISGGLDTLDKVFLLSLNEDTNTKYGFNSDMYAFDKARRCKLTDFADNKGCTVSTDAEYYGNCNWWLRTPGKDLEHSLYVLWNGRNYMSGGYVYRLNYGGVRPALHIELNNDLWKNAGTVNSDGVETKPPVQTKVKLTSTKIKSVKSKKKSLKIKWKKVSGINGYELQYSLKKNFKKAKTITIKKAKTTSKTIKKLKKKKKYFIRIRTYKIINGKKYQSAWSKAKSKKTK